MLMKRTEEELSILHADMYLTPESITWTIEEDDDDNPR